MSVRRKLTVAFVNFTRQVGNLLWQESPSRGPQTIDDKSGPAAVVCNMENVLPEDRLDYYVVVLERFYTSVALALELLANKICSVETIQPKTNWISLCAEGQAQETPD